MNIYLCTDHLKQVSDATEPGKVAKLAIWSDGSAPCTLCGLTPTTAIPCGHIEEGSPSGLPQPAVVLLATKDHRIDSLLADQEKGKAS